MNFLVFLCLVLYLVSSEPTLHTLSGLRSNGAVSENFFNDSQNNFVTREVLHFQTNGAPSTMSGADYLKTFQTNLTSMSTCFRLYLTQERPYASLISYSIEGHDNELLIGGYFYGSRSIEFYCCQSRVATFALGEPLKLLQWMNMCLVADLQKSILYVIIDGNTTTVNLVDLTYSSNPLYIQSGGFLTLGQDQDSVNGGYMAGESLSGYILDFFISGDLIKIEDAISYTTCKNIFLGSKSIINTDNMKDDFKLKEQTEWLSVEIDETCSKPTKYYVMYTEERTFYDAVKFCQAMNGVIPAPKTKLENDFLVEQFPLFSKICKKLSDCRFWLGYVYSTDSKMVQHYITNQIATYTNFISPVLTTENTCTVTWVNEKNEVGLKNWRSFLCSTNYYTVCTFNNIPTFNARGFCEDTLFDRTYYIYGYKDKKPIFHGSRESRIIWIKQNSSMTIPGYWTLILPGKPDTYAEMKMNTADEYPVGERSWTFYGDKCIPDGENSQLMITACGEGMFTCGDGLCIEMEQRCNLVEDCVDQSDEFDCGVLIVPDGYDIRFSPPKTHVKNPIIVDFNITIYAIRGIMLIDNEIVLEFGYQRRWYDSQVWLKNLKNQTSQNIINDLEQRIWYPSTDFYGENYCLSLAVNKYELAWADKMTPPLPDLKNTLRPDDMYDGRDNPLNMLRKYDSRFVCVYDLADYPFDTQRCHLAWLLATATSDFAVLKRNTVKFVGQTVLLEYEVTDLQFKDIIFLNSSGQQVIIEFTNMYTYYITSTYVPTWLLIVISYFAFWFPIDDFNDRVMVSLTSLLVLASLFAQVSAGLPKTSYLKLIDVWFIACIVMDFLMVAMLVVINRRSGSVMAVRTGKLDSQPIMKKILLKLILDHHQLNALSKIVFLITIIVLTIIYLAYVIYVLQYGFRGATFSYE